VIHRARSRGLFCSRPLPLAFSQRSSWF